MLTLTPTQQHVLTLLAGGSSVTAAAQAAGVHRNTIGNWRRACPEFRQAFGAAREEQEQLWHEQVDSLGALAISTLQDILKAGPFSSALNGPAANLCMRTALAVIDRIYKSESKNHSVGSAQLSPQAQIAQPIEPVQLPADSGHLQTPLSAQSGEPAKSDQMCTTYEFRAERRAAAERAGMEAFDAAQAKEQAAIRKLEAQIMQASEETAKRRSQSKQQPGEIARTATQT